MGVITEPESVDFAALIARLGLSTGASAEALERAARHDSRAKFAAWREAQIASLPNWGAFARWTHAPWAGKVSRSLRGCLAAWSAFDAAPSGNVVPVGGALVLGPSGVGKSTGLFASLSAQVRALRLEVEAGRQKFTAAPSFVWTTEAALVREQGQRQNSLYCRCASSGILILDEIGAGGGHVAQVGQSPVLFALLAERYDRGFATSATSGMSVRAIAARYGTGCARRLVHGSVIVDLFDSGVNAR